MADIFNLTDTWNNGATTFKAIQMDVTDTASVTESGLLDLKIGGVSKFYVMKNGAVFPGGVASGASNNIGMVPHTNGDTILGFNYNYFFRLSPFTAGGGFGSSAFILSSTAALAWAGAGGATNGSDTFITRQGASGVVSVSNDGTTGFGAIRTTATTVASLPSAATVGAGTRAFVTDATASTFASTVAGGGSTNVPVYSDGTNWRIG